MTGLVGDTFAAGSGYNVSGSVVSAGALAKLVLSSGSTATNVKVGGGGSVVVSAGATLSETVASDIPSGGGGSGNTDDCDDKIFYSGGLGGELPVSGVLSNTATLEIGGGYGGYGGSGGELVVSSGGMLDHAGCSGSNGGLFGALAAAAQVASWRCPQGRC